MPSARPTAQAIPKDVKRAKSAAASAGTICSGSVCQSRAVIDAASTPIPPATRQASSVLAIDRRLGDSPTSIADTSFSDAALVARPKRLQR
jgi:hypothetical protein